MFKNIWIEAATFVGKFSSRKTQRTQIESKKRFRIIRQMAIVTSHLSFISFSLHIKIDISSATIYKYISSFIPNVYRSCYMLIFDHVCRYGPLWHTDTMPICSQEGVQSKIQFNILKSDFHLPKKFLFTSIKALKNDKKCFLFYAKSSFRSWDIYIFVLNFGYGKKLFDKKAIQNF